MFLGGFFTINRLSSTSTPRTFEGFFVQLCLVTARPLDGRKTTEVQKGNLKLEIVTDYCYPSDIVYAVMAVQFHQLLKISLTSSSFYQLPHFVSN